MRCFLYQLAKTSKPCIFATCTIFLLFNTRSYHVTQIFFPFANCALFMHVVCSLKTKSELLLLTSKAKVHLGIK